MQDPDSTDEKHRIEVELLNHIAKEQSDGIGSFPKGTFPSFRYHPFLPYVRADDNLFFTASIVRVLQGLSLHFTEEEKRQAGNIIDNALSSYELFRNKDGGDTYNFWQTAQGRHFPNGLFMHRFDHFRIPDDADDTALALLTQHASEQRVGALRKKLPHHANLAYRRAFNPSAKYRDKKIYSTFFGKRMYIEFDICVLSNLMRLILRFFSNSLNEYDRGTLDFIVQVILDDDHLNRPFYSAPNYPRPEVILYHVARLIPWLPDEYAQKIRVKTVNDMLQRLGSATGMDRVLLENGLMKLGQTTIAQESSWQSLADDGKFFFFHAGMITAFENSLAQSLADRSLFHLRYRCRSINLSLILENYVLRRITSS